MVDDRTSSSFVLLVEVLLVVDHVDGREYLHVHDVLVVLGQVGAEQVLARVVAELKGEAFRLLFAFDFLFCIGFSFCWFFGLFLGNYENAVGRRIKNVV